MTREALILSHLPQVQLIARRLRRRLPRHVSLDDLVSCGVLGLIQAVDGFDPSRQIQFKTYAEHRIRGAILDSRRGADKVIEQSAEAVDADDSGTETANLNQRLDHQSAAQRIAGVISERERDLLWQSLVDETPLYVLAQRMGVSASYLSQFRARALARVQTRLPHLRQEISL